MDVHETDIDGVLRFVPQPHRDARGLFTRTFDAAIGARHKVVFGPGSQDSQSRSEPGVLRGLHGRLGDGESKLVRVSAGAVLDVVVDARPTSPTFGRHIAVVLDDQEFAACTASRCCAARRTCSTASTGPTTRPRMSRCVTTTRTWASRGGPARWS